MPPTKEKRPTGKVKPSSAIPVPTYPILAIRETIMFPAMVLPITITDEAVIEMVNGMLNGNKRFAYFLVKETSVSAGQAPQEGGLEEEAVHPYDLYEYGTLSEVLKKITLPDGGIRILAQGLERIKLKRIARRTPTMTAEVEIMGERPEDTPRTRALMKNVAGAFLKLAKQTPYIPEEMQTIVVNLTDPVRLGYFVASNMNISLPEKQRMLELDSPSGRLERLDALLHRELQILQLGKKIESEVQGEFEKVQRDHFLREQLRVIQKELGQNDERTVEIGELQDKIEKARLPREAREAADQELNRLRRIPPGMPEYTVARTYLDWLTELPWSVQTEERLDIRNAKRILDEDHFGLNRIKERILEHLAVRKLKSDMKGPILCFLGPPGVGKTSLGMSIARAMGRKFVRVSLGGIRDEAEIRGHRRTYVGSLPGRVIQSIRRAGSKNPVFMLDELDKVGTDFRGDPSSALLEVLDPEQNHGFQDHYLDVPFDLSKVFFIATANITDTIPPALLDRMEIIELPGYSEEEKFQIARRHLVPKQMGAHGLTRAMIRFDNGALKKLISGYTDEAGLRNFEREIAGLCRKVAKEIVTGRKKSVRVMPPSLVHYLGPERYFQDKAERATDVGIATGLAWTRTGGEILFIEATRMPGSKTLMLTGHIGDVMKESAQAALSYLRSRVDKYGLDKTFYEKSDLHIHIPAGAIPKDGPSAGITLTAALYSLLKGEKILPSVAMTGEVTLRGKVLPVGGIKEKILAARRAGIRTVIMPERNKKDLAELPAEVRREMRFLFVHTVDDMIRRAFPNSKP